MFSKWFCLPVIMRLMALCVFLTDALCSTERSVTIWGQTHPTTATKFSWQKEKGDTEAKLVDVYQIINFINLFKRKCQPEHTRGEPDSYSKNCPPSDCHRVLIWTKGMTQIGAPAFSCLECCIDWRVFWPKLLKSS